MMIIMRNMFIMLVCFVGMSVSAQPLVSAGALQSGDYYFVKPDLRRCAAPRCGGVFVQKVNHRSMRCPDGKRALQCYIHQFDASQLPLDPFGGQVDHQTVVFKGTIKSDTVKLSNDTLKLSNDTLIKVATFNASEVYYRAGKVSRVGKLWALQSSVSRCITEPCFYGVAQLMNTGFKRSFSSYDLSKAGLSENQQAEVKHYLQQGEPVLTRAIRRSYKGDAGRGIRFVPTEVYLPLVSRSPVGQVE